MKKKTPLEKTPQVALKASTLEGQDKKAGAGCAETGLTSLKSNLTRSPRKPRKGSKKKKKMRPSFEELLA